LTCQTLGEIFGLSDAIIGLTIFAVGNSLADLVANMSVAVCGLNIVDPSISFHRDIGVCPDYGILCVFRWPYAQYSPWYWTFGLMGRSHNTETVPFQTLHDSSCQHYWSLISPGGDSDLCTVERILSNKTLGDVAYCVVCCHHDHQCHSRGQKTRLITCNLTMI